MNYLCFDVGGTTVKYAVLKENYEICRNGDFPSRIDSGAGALLTGILNTIREIRNNFIIKGIGISSPGIIDTKNGIVTYANERTPGFQGINYRETIYEETGLPCSAENDANCFALAETLYNKGDFLVVTIGTGIGGAVVLGGKLYHGINNSAGAFGQMIVADNKKWEETASLKSAVQAGKQARLAVCDGRDLFCLYDGLNETALEIVEKFYHYLAVGLLNLTYIFSPPEIIIAGGITTRPSFPDELNAHYNKLVNPAYTGATKIKISRHKNNGGFIGALVHYLNDETKGKQ